MASVRTLHHSNHSSRIRLNSLEIIVRIFFPLYPFVSLCIPLCPKVGSKSGTGNPWFSLLTKSWALAGESEPDQTKGHRTANATPTLQPSKLLYGKMVVVCRSDVRGEHVAFYVEHVMSGGCCALIAVIMERINEIVKNFMFYSSL